MIIIRKICAIILSLQLFCWAALPASGWCMTQAETTEYKMIPIAQWQQLTEELTRQKNELNQLQDLCHKLSKPSMELQQELQKAKEQLQKSETELQNVKHSLIAASSALDESKTSLQTLRQAIEKERRVHRRQIWQNRLWLFVFGVAAGTAAKNK